MPRKQRMAKARVDLPLSPAWAFLLITGTFAPCRVPGWVELAQAAVRTVDRGFDYTGAGNLLWGQHGAALVREAASHGFVAYWASKKAPHGPGFQAWVRAFVATHRY